MCWSLSKNGQIRTTCPSHANTNSTSTTSPDVYKPLCTLHCFACLFYIHSDTTSATDGNLERLALGLPFPRLFRFPGFFLALILKFKHYYFDEVH